MCNCNGHECEHGGGHPSPRMERFLQPGLLLLLAEKPSYGYELIERIGRFMQENAPDVGTVYRNLRRLEVDGAVTSHWEEGDQGPQKRLYTLTPTGIELLQNWSVVMRRNRNVLDQFLQRYAERFEATGSKSGGNG